MQERVKPTGKLKSKPKLKKVTLNIDARLAAEAANSGVDLAAVLEHALRRALDANKPLTAAERSNLKALERYVAEHGAVWDPSESE